MYALLSLVVCLAGQPAICATVVASYAHPETGGPDGLVYLLTDERDGGLYRLEPAEGAPAEG